MKSLRFVARRLVQTALIAICALGGTACTDIVGQLSPLRSATPVTEPDVVLTSSIEIRPIGGDARTLKQNTRWLQVGTIAEGTVYKPRGDILTAEAINVHEAYLVVRGDDCVGMWLPFEKAFVPLATVTPIRLSGGR